MITLRRVLIYASATFIALDKIQYLKSASEAQFKAPAGSERLYDLIKVQKPEVKVAFYFALRDTLVTDVIDRATKYDFLSH